jgi:hypothetical protein
MNNFSSNIFLNYTIVFEKLCADDVVCSSLGVSSAQHGNIFGNKFEETFLEAVDVNNFSSNIFPSTP